VAFWRLFPHSTFKKNTTRKTTGGHRETIGGKHGNYRRPTRGGREKFSLF